MTDWVTHCMWNVNNTHTGLQVPFTIHAPFFSALLQMSQSNRGYSVNTEHKCIVIKRSYCWACAIKINVKWTLEMVVHCIMESPQEIHQDGTGKWLSHDRTTTKAADHVNARELFCICKQSLL